MHINKKRLHPYELPLQYHLQKRKESYELPAKSENQMQQEFLLPGSDDQGYFHGLYKCPAISGVFYQKKGHPILPDFVLTDQKQLYVEAQVPYGLLSQQLLTKDCSISLIFYRTILR